MSGKAGRKNTPESRLRNGAVLRSCEVCGAEFWSPRWEREKGAGRYCSRPCHYEGMRGRPIHRDPPVNKVVRRSDGYLDEWAPDHPKALSGRVLQHRLVAERMIGRYLLPGEQVHHINHQRDDNRPENLRVVDIAEHARHHALADRASMAARARRNPRPRDPKSGRFLSG